jgi:hypothetical protein
MNARLDCHMQALSVGEGGSLLREQVRDLQASMPAIRRSPEQRQKPRMILLVLSSSELWGQR